MSRAAARRSKPQATERPALHLVPDNEPVVKWAEYPRIQPGEYPAYCKRATWYWEPGFKRWTCILKFDVLKEGQNTLLGTIPVWFNGGAGERPKAGRRTLYFPAWVKANGGPPARRDRLSPSVGFVNLIWPLLMV